MAINWPWKRRKPQDAARSWTLTGDEGWVNTSWDAGFWQQNLKGPQGILNETVEACVSTLSQTLSMCPAYHLRDLETGEAQRRRGSNVERVLKQPNNYQTRTLFFNNAIRSLYFSGNAYAVALRDDRGAISQLHLLDPRGTRGVFSAEDGGIYYWIAPLANGPRLDEFNDAEDMIVPARNMMHLRIATSRDPLKGESPLVAAAASVSASSALTNHQSKFFNNMARPSGGLFTDATLSKDQMGQLREAVNAQSQRDDSGKVPIFSNGLKWESMSLSSQDAQLVEAYGMTVEGISRVFRVPLALINDMRQSTFNNSEQLMNWFLSSGLGWLLEHVELELGRLFNLNFDERVNFDTRILLRSDWKTRIDTLGEGVQKGIYSPNEARALEGLPPAEDGDEPRVQQQVIPLSAWDQEAPAPEPAAESEPVDVAASLMSGVQKGLASVA